MFDHKSDYFFGDAARLWWIFIIAGIFTLASPYMITLDVSNLRTFIVSIVAISIGLTLKLNYFGLQIDKSKSQIRHYTAFFGVKTGDWQLVPPFHKITLTSRDVSSWNTPNGISPTFKSNKTTYTVALFSNAETPEIFIQTENKNLAVQKAQQLYELFGIEIERF